jgi:hypothetical protein
MDHGDGTGLGDATEVLVGYADGEVREAVAVEVARVGGDERRGRPLGPRRPDRRRQQRQRGDHRPHPGPTVRTAPAARRPNPVDRSTR